MCFSRDVATYGMLTSSVRHSGPYSHMCNTVDDTYFRMIPNTSHDTMDDIQRAVCYMDAPEPRRYHGPDGLKASMMQLEGGIMVLLNVRE